MPREELQSRLGLAPPTFGPVLSELAAAGVLAERNGEVALPAHEVKIEPGGPAARLVEILGARLNTIHNLHFYLSLMARAREAIEGGRFEAFRREPQLKFLTIRTLAALDRLQAGNQHLQVGSARFATGQQEILADLAEARADDDHTAHTGARALLQHPHHLLRGHRDHGQVDLVGKLGERGVGAAVDDPWYPAEMEARFKQAFPRFVASLLRGFRDLSKVRSTPNEQRQTEENRPGRVEEPG